MLSAKKTGFGAREKIKNQKAKIKNDNTTENSELETWDSKLATRNFLTCGLGP